MSAVGKAVFGGNSHAVTSPNYQSMSNDEQNRLGDIESKINELFGNQSGQFQNSLTQSQDVQSLFQQNLKQFLTSGGQATPEQIAAVDSNFTRPAQAQLNQQLQDVQSNYNANAAAMGRSPNLDLASQQAFASDAARANLNLQAERGNRIQQNSLNVLNAGQQGSGFLNGLTQQAFSNQMQLLNGRSGIADYYQRQRGQGAVGQTSSPGLFGYLGAAGTAIGAGAKGYASIGALTSGNGNLLLQNNQKQSG